MITFNWQYNPTNQFYILSFTFHPDEKPYDNIWKAKDAETFTWVPRHTESGYIAQLLSLANQINGLPISKRERLREIIDRNLTEDYHFKLTDHNIKLITTAFEEVDGLWADK